MSKTKVELLIYNQLYYAKGQQTHYINIKNSYEDQLQLTKIWVSERVLALGI